MNKKWIARRLKKVHDEFVASITDASVQALVRENSIITGGAIASLLADEKVKDYDYYFTDFQTAHAVAEYYAKRYNDENQPKIPVVVQVYDEDGKQLDVSAQQATGPQSAIKARIKLIVKSAGVAGAEKKDDDYKYFEQHPDEQGVAYVNEAFSVVADRLEEGDDIPAAVVDELAESDKKKKREKYSPVFVSLNAITLSGGVQLVTRFYGDAAAVHENFDFIHCTNYWTSAAGGTLVLKQAALESLMAKQLYYNGSRYPLCSVIRTRKFLKRGWVINAGQYLKMCFQISQLDLTNVRVLEEQLTGVDTAYFGQLIEICREKVAADENFRIDDIYISTLVDRLF